MVEQVEVTTQDIIAVAEFRSALRHFLRRSEKIARQSGLTPQRYTLLMMIKGAPDGGEQSTVTELSERMQLAHRRFDAISLVREGEARPAGRELPRDRPRDRALVGNTEDEAPLAFERSGHAPILER